MTVLTQFPNYRGEVVTYLYMNHYESIDTHKSVSK